MPTRSSAWTCWDAGADQSSAWCCQTELAQRFVSLLGPHAIWQSRTKMPEDVGMLLACMLTDDGAQLVLLTVVLGLSVKSTTFGSGDADLNLSKSAAVFGCCTRRPCRPAVAASAMPLADLGPVAKGSPPTISATRHSRHHDQRHVST